mmetsp:Transcript_28633/g.97540  ORF Transcript_28633/g.97540 Transcript_28633/m.97540 type:complete len:223 (+) Transcript_28633:211-879(+)
MRRMRAAAKMWTRGVSAQSPAAPWSCMAWSAIRWSVAGTNALTMERSWRVCASVLPLASMRCAASRTRWRAASMSPRARATSSSTPSRAASGLPKATRDSARAHMSESARSHWPMARMQWWMRPGPRRRWAISKPLPGSQRTESFGTRRSSKTISMWPLGASSSPKTVNGRTSRMPGASMGTRSMDCCAWGGASTSVLPMRIMTLQCKEPAPVIHHLRPLTT